MLQSCPREASTLPTDSCCLLRWQGVHVIRIPPDRLERFIEVLEGMGAQHIETKGEHEAFRVEMGRWTLVGYATGKVTFDEDQLVEVLEDALREVIEPPQGPVVGSDEAGKGEWLGPLVAAACAVVPGDRAALIARGVMDSKDVSPRAMARVAEAVEDVCPYNAVVMVSPSRFNELWPRFKEEGKSLNDLVAWAHAKALGDVIGQLEDAGEASGVRVVVDEFSRVATEARTSRAFDVEEYPVEQRPRAEDEIAVAAASVLARAARERWIDAFERRESTPVRSLDRDGAREHEKKGLFAKVGYL